MLKIKIVFLSVIIFSLPLSTKLLSNFLLAKASVSKLVAIFF